jgi:penicillin-binding protein 2
VAFAPYDKPEIAVAVIVEHGEHGGRAAAPIAGKLLKAYFEGKGVIKKPVSKQASEADEEDAPLPGAAPADAKSGTKAAE